MKHAIFGWAAGALLLLAGCGSDGSTTSPQPINPGQDTATASIPPTDTSTQKPDTSSTVPPAQPDTSATVPDTTAPEGPQLSAELPGTWNADSSFMLNAGFFSIPVGATMSVTFLPDGTFSSFIDASFMANPVEGHLYTQSGTWTAVSADSVRVEPTSCMAADTIMDPTYRMALPFKQVQGGFVANELKPSDCPDPSWIAQHPVDGALVFTMPVTLPVQGRSLWTLTFKKQP